MSGSRLSQNCLHFENEPFPGNGFRQTAFPGRVCTDLLRRQRRPVSVWPPRPPCRAPNWLINGLQGLAEATEAVYLDTEAPL